MFCPKCGATIPDADNKEKSGSKVVKNILLVLLILVLMAVSGLGTAAYMTFHNKTSGATYEGKGFNTPEEAAKAYAEAFANKDINEMLSCCAIESYVDNFDYEAQIERYGAYTPTAFYGPVMTGDDEATRQMDIEERKGQLVNHIIRGYLRASQPIDSPIFSGLVLQVGDGKEYDADEIVDMLRGAGTIDSIKVGDVEEYFDFANTDPPETSEKFLKALKKVFGGKVESMVVDLEIDGEDYLLFVDVIQYDDRWYVLTPMGYYGAAYAGMDATSGGVIKVEDFEE